MRLEISAASRLELMQVAAIPLSCSCRTWSCISAISGERTSVTPLRRMAGSWKHRDFPPPVGITAITSRPFRTSRTIASCPGRNESNPNERFRCARSCALVISSSGDMSLRESAVRDVASVRATNLASRVSAMVRHRRAC